MKSPHKTTFLFILSLFILNGTKINAQNQSIQESKPFIEVNGYAEKEILPDEIYVSITIFERYENKEKVTIEMQEQKLIASIKEIQIPINNLEVYNTYASYKKSRWFNKDGGESKEYTLKLSDATQLALVFQFIDKLEIKDAYIKRVGYSKIDSLKKELKIQAIKNAKEKADYLLNAIGEQTGKPLIVQERETNINPDLSAEYFENYRGGSKSFIDGQRVIGSAGGSGDELNFKKIKVKAILYVKFTIK